MSNMDLSQWWASERDNIARGAVESKNAQSAWSELSKLYSSLSSNEKKEVVPVLIDWIDSDDNGKRSDAIWLVREYKILAAKQALERLRIRLKHCRIPEDPQGYHECQKVIGVLQILDEQTNERRNSRNDF